MATIKDIAKVTGFSVTTVSRALNDFSDVNEKTKIKIKEAAKQLNYSPNALARSLVMNKTKTIGLLVSGLTRDSVKDNFTYEVMCGINDYVGQIGYDLIVFNTNTSKQKEKSYIQLCRERMVEGVIIQGIRTDDLYLQEIIESDIPCVLLDIPFVTDTVGYITTDNIQGAQQAVEHLIALGHNKIAMINGYDEAVVSKLRFEGYKTALEDAGIPLNTDLVKDGQWKELVSYSRAKNLLIKNPDITGIFCASDLMALGVLKAAKELNIQVPNELSVIGYDDIVLASYTNPALTTVAQDKYQMGYEATKLLINILEGKADKHYTMLESELIIRESTAEKN